MAACQYSGIEKKIRGCPTVPPCAKIRKNNSLERQHKIVAAEKRFENLCKPIPEMC